MNLSRHLQGKYHGWSKKRSAAALGEFGLRADYKKKIYVSPKKKINKKLERKNKWVDYHLPQTCPIKNCSRIVKNKSEHLSKFHKLKKDSTFYQLLSGVKPLLPSISPRKSPRKQCELAPRKQCEFILNKSARLRQNKGNGNLEPQEIVNVFRSEKINLKKHHDEFVENNLNLNLEHGIASGGESVDGTSDDNDTDYIPETYELDGRRDGRIHCSEYIEGLLEEFNVYLVGPDRGRKKESVIEVVNDVRRIFVAVNATNSLASVFDDHNVTLRNNYLMGVCVEREMKPGSVKKYLYSLIDFCSFLLTEKNVVENVVFDNILTTKLRVEGWRRSYRCKDNLQRHVRNAADFEMLVTPSQVQTYENSDHAKMAKRLFVQLQSSPGLQTLSQKEYCCVRDHLFSLIHFTNGHRSGVTANLLMKEYLKAKSLEKDVVEIGVWNHKTVNYYGPAKITLNAEGYSWLQIFVTSARKQLHNIKDSNVFLSWSGSAMKSGDVSKRIHTLWCKAGIFDNRDLSKNLSCNIIRKSTSTGMRESGTGKYQEIADLMAHSKSTANNHYFLRKQEKSAATATSLIRSHFYADLDPLVASPKRKKWDESELNTLSTVLSKVDSVTKENITDVVESLPPGIKLNASPKQIYDKVRNMAREEKSNDDTRTVSISQFSGTIFHHQNISLVDDLEQCFSVT